MCSVKDGCVVVVLTMVELLESFADIEDYQEVADAAFTILHNSPF